MSDHRLASAFGLGVGSGFALSALRGAWEYTGRLPRLQISPIDHKFNLSSAPADCLVRVVVAFEKKGREPNTAASSQQPDSQPSSGEAEQQSDRERSAARLKKPGWTQPSTATRNRNGSVTPPSPPPSPAPHHHHHTAAESPPCPTQTPSRTPLRQHPQTSQSSSRTPQTSLAA